MEMQSDFFINNLHKMIKYVFYKVNIPTLICLLLKNIIIDKAFETSNTTVLSDSIF